MIEFQGRWMARVAVASLLIATAGAALAQDGTLHGAAAWQALVGNTAEATTKAGSYTEFYDPAGTLRHADADGVTAGTWTQSGDEICFDYPDDDDHVCMKIEVSGTTGRFIDPDGTVDLFTVLKGNAKSL